MARKSRTVLPGTLQYLSCRTLPGVALDAESMRDLSALMRESATRTDTLILGWCVLPDRVDVLLLATVADSVARWLRWTLTTFTMRHKARTGRQGGLWRKHPCSTPVQAGAWAGSVLRWLTEVLPREAGLALPWPYAQVSLIGQPHLAAARGQGLDPASARWIAHALTKGRPIGDPAWMAWYARLTGEDGPPSKRGRPRWA